MLRVLSQVDPDCEVVLADGSPAYAVGNEMADQPGNNPHVVIADAGRVQTGPMRRDPQAWTVGAGDGSVNVGNLKAVLQPLPDDVTVFLSSSDDGTSMPAGVVVVLDAHPRVVFVPASAVAGLGGPKESHLRAVDPDEEQTES